MTHPDPPTAAPPELAPELAALEARLGAARPSLTDETPRERTKAAALLELCRQAAPQSPNLIETILEAGEQRVTQSLRQYIRAERFRAGAVGIVLGLILGGLLNAFSIAFLFMVLKNI